MNESPLRTLPAFAYAMSLLLAPPLGATDTPNTEPAQEKSAKIEDQPPAPAASPTATLAQLESELPVYRPPRRGAPVNRISGGTRGGAGKVPTLEVLAPPHTGWTVEDQPVLYWFLSRPSHLPVEVTLADEQAVQPLLSVTLPAATEGVLQKISLADHGVRLEEGKEYQWSVALIENPEQRSRDIVATGSIRRVAKSESLSSKIAGVSADERARLFAEAGLWYDAVAVAAELAGNGRSRIALARLLEQGELTIPLLALRDVGR
jgi:hypothetical protein